MNKLNYSRFVNLLSVMTSPESIFIDEIPFSPSIKKSLKIQLPDNVIIQKLLELRKYGMIGKLKEAHIFNDEPKIFYGFNCIPDKEIKFGEYGGCFSLNKENGILRTLGESVERYCLKIIPENTLKDSYNNLTDNKHADVLDISKCINFSDEQLKPKSRGKYIEKIKKSRIRWVTGINLVTKKRTCLPSQLIFVPSDYKVFRKEPLIRIPISTGAAFGIEKDGIDAIYRGIMECIERDSNMITWLSKKTPKRVILDTPLLEKIENEFKKYKLEIYVFDITTDIKIPSFMTIIKDVYGGPEVAVGSKAGLNPETAVLGAVMEAFQARLFIRSVKILENSKIEKPDKIIDMKTRSLYFCDDGIKKLKFILKNKKKIKLSRIKNLEKSSLNSNIKFVLNKLKKLEYDVYAVDISNKKMKKSEFYVKKIIIPDLHPLYLDERLPYFYSKRLTNHGGLKNTESHPFP